MRYGITSLFYGHLESLRKNRRKIAPLMLVGKLEDYLCKEFSLYVHNESEGKRLALSNIGNKGQRKYDLSIINKDREIEALIEAKYLGNRHRDSEYSAEDNISTTIKILSDQCIPPASDKHGHHGLKLSSKLGSVYGMVFCGYTAQDDEKYEENKASYFGKCINAGNRHGFRYHDLSSSALRYAFEDEEFTSLGNTWYSTLQVGLWRID